MLVACPEAGTVRVFGSVLFFCGSKGVIGKWSCTWEFGLNLVCGSDLNSRFAQCHKTSVDRVCSCIGTFSVACLW